VPKIDELSGSRQVALSGQSVMRDGTFASPTAWTRLDGVAQQLSFRESVRCPDG
jgi:hypothetical protein